MLNRINLLLLSIFIPLSICLLIHMLACLVILDIPDFEQQFFVVIRLLTSLFAVTAFGFALTIAMED